jgi:hypothetical protein
MWQFRLFASYPVRVDTNYAVGPRFRGQLNQISLSHMQVSGQLKIIDESISESMENIGFNELSWLSGIYARLKQHLWVEMEVFNRRTICIVVE